jgi:hypothetical protein
VQLEPKRVTREVVPSLSSDQAQPEVAANPGLVEQAVRYYETASYRFQHGMMGASGSGVGVKAHP